MCWLALNDHASTAAKSFELKGYFVFDHPSLADSPGRIIRSFLILVVPAFLIPDSTAASDGKVQVLFNLTDPEVGPFPADQFTTADPSQITGRRVVLPKPDCAKQASDCEDIDILNKLDGFSLQPRMAVSFNGPIQISSISGKSVFVVSYGAGGTRIIGINEVVWDPSANTLYFTTDEMLVQHSSYALIVTRSLLDASGNPLEASGEFSRFLSSGSGEYRDRLRAAIDAAVSAGVVRSDIACASAFTTLSATAMLEKMRDQIKAATPKPASFVFNGARAVYSKDSISSMVVHLQTRITPPGFGDVTVNLSLLDAVPDSVGTLAFGSFESPNYLIPQRVIPQVPTLTGVPEVQGVETLRLVLTLPKGTAPGNGWPVAIYGHANGGLKENMYNFSSILAKHGFATIGINVPGHGYGPESTLELKLKSGETVTLPSGGRGVDVDGNNTLSANEGVIAMARPYTMISNRDGIRQVVADLMQLVRVIQMGMDVDGDGTADLDPAKLYYFGGSLGGNYGVPFLAVEPAVRAGAPSFAGYSRADAWRLGAFRGQLSNLLQQRIPPLINSNGITQISGLAVPAPYFNENKPLRNLPVIVNDVPGAIEIQRVLSWQSWASMCGDPNAYSQHLQKRPLEGMTAHPVLFQFAKGDQTVPVTASTALIRAGDLARSSTYLRYDLAYASIPGLPSRNPHTIHTAIGIPSVAPIARGMQEQVAMFFESDGATIPQAEPAEFFETPVKELPENIEYMTPTPGIRTPVELASSDQALTPGGLFSATGATNSPADPQSLPQGPLQNSLWGVMLTINGRPAPLSYVSRTEVRGQVPYETTAGPAIAQLVTYGISGARLPLEIVSVAPRLFVGEGNQCLAQNEDGTMNSAANPAKAGRYVGAYLTGVGPVSPAAITGMPAGAVPLSRPVNPVSASLGSRTLQPGFLGLIPGFVGMAEADVLIPADMPAGTHGFSVTVGSASSNTCQLTVTR